MPLCVEGTNFINFDKRDNQVSGWSTLPVWPVVIYVDTSDGAGVRLIGWSAPASRWSHYSGHTKIQRKSWIRRAHKRNISVLGINQYTLLTTQWLNESKLVSCLLSSCLALLTEQFSLIFVMSLIIISNILLWKCHLITVCF